MKSYLKFTGAYFIPFIVLLDFLYSFFILKDGSQVITLLIGLLFAIPIFLGVAQLTGWILRKIIKSHHQNTEVPNTFLLALGVLLFLNHIDIGTWLQSHNSGENSIIWLGFMAAMFLAPILFGVLSGCLVLLEHLFHNESKNIVRWGQVLSILTVILFMAIVSMTFRSNPL